MARRGYPGHRTTAFSTPRKTSEAAVTFIVWNSKAGTHSTSRPEIATWNRPPAPEAVLSSRPKIPSTLASGRSTPLAEGFGN